LVWSCAGKTRRRWRSPWLLRPWGGGGAEEERWVKAEEQKRREALKSGKTGAATTTRESDANIEGGDDVEDFDGDDNMMDEDDVDESNPMAALIASAQKAAKKYDRELLSGDEDDGMDDSEDDSEDDEDDVEGLNLPNAGSSRKAYDKVFKQVVDQADVVLYVVDARDPESTRSREVERMVMAAASGGKRLMLILNKVDLIPGWAAVSLPFLSWLLSLSLPEYFVSPPFRLSSTSAPCTVRLPDIVASDEQEGLFSP